MKQSDPHAGLDAFLTRYPVKTFKKGEIILFQGEAPRSTYVVKSGIIKSYNISVSGDEKPVGYIVHHEIFPAPWTFQKAPSALYYYEAFMDAELYVVPREEYIAFLKSSPELLFSELEHYVGVQLGTAMRLNALQHSRASDKLIYTLHYLALTHGRPVDTGVVEVSLNLTHQDFANLTGLTRETTATELNKLKTAGIISYGKHTLYQVDVAKLNHVLNDQFIAELEITL
ncbi:MAG TPA: Crp/Fnr family transcriptional regulator [Candidatus Saccharimonadales bacterium]|nr:Crp/Fnr family transcriptional regulator [Candidatus Saccharimonadales bacterium]